MDTFDITTDDISMTEDIALLTERRVCPFAADPTLCLAPSTGDIVASLPTGDLWADHRLGFV